MQFERLGPYKIGKRLGRGGMGAVYEAVNVDSSELAAVKLLNPHLADDEGFRERFELEIETLKKLKHPNIVRMLGYGEEQGYLYYAMELVRGHSVEEELQLGRRFTWREVVQHSVKLCKALRHAHDHGVIHRDIKPANLLITDDGDIKLTDFGIARLFGNNRLTMEGGLVGTAEYMSPEQANGERVTPLSDIYSLGSVMFAMLAGRPPFRTSSLPEMLQKQRFEEAPPLSRFVAGIPPELEEVVARLLLKDPHARAPNALVLSRQLGSMEHGLSIVRQRPMEEAPSGGEEVELEGNTVGDELAPSTPSEPKQALEIFTGGVPYDPNAPTLVAPGGSAAVAPLIVKPVAKAPRTATDKKQSSIAEPSQAEPAAPQETDSKATIVQSRFTTVEEDEQRRDEIERNLQRQPAYLQVGILAISLLMILGLLWYLTRPPTEEALFSRIRATAANDTDPATILTVDDDVRSYLERFPNAERAAEVKRIQEEINLQRMEQRFRLRARLAARDDALSPIERDYLEAMNYLGTNREETVNRLQAIVDLYGAQREKSEITTDVTELAKRELTSLREQTAKASPEYVRFINSNLQRARQLQQTSPAEAIGIWQGIVTLYGDKPWAARQVAEARAALASTDTATNK
jgi:eukaryotic-like serine/threonine-protein kinase